MGILPDYEIVCLARRGMVNPYDPELVNPASLDVRLGEQLLMIEDKQTSELAALLNRWALRRKRRSCSSHASSYWRKRWSSSRSRCVVAGQLALKSSRAREGIEHLMAGYIDPGYAGRLTLELVNARVLHPVPLWPGMRIGQIVFHKMSLLPNKDYSVTGRYQGDQTVQASKG